MREIAAAVYTLLMLWAGGRYCRGIIRGTVKPVFATWLIIWVAVNLSLLTYFSSGKRLAGESLITNIANSVDLLNVWVYIIVIALSARTAQWSLTPLRVSCLAVALILTVMWLLFRVRVAFEANLAFQGIMVVSYFPTMHHLWSTEENTEDLQTWTLVLAAQAAALYPPLAAEPVDLLAFVYALRAFVMVLIVILFILRIKLRSKGVPA